MAKLKRWTPEEDDQLLQMVECGDSMETIALALNLSESAIKQHLDKLGSPAEKPNTSGWYTFRYQLEGRTSKESRVHAKNQADAAEGLNAKIKEAYPDTPLEQFAFENFEPDFIKPEAIEKTAGEIKQKHQEILDSVDSGKTITRIEVKKDEDPARLNAELKAKHEKFLEREKEKQMTDITEVKHITEEEHEILHGGTITGDVVSSQDPDLLNISYDINGRLIIEGMVFSKEHTKRIINYCDDLKMLGSGWMR